MSNSLQVTYDVTTNVCVFSELEELKVVVSTAFGLTRYIR